MTIHSLFQLPVRTLIPTPQSYRQLFAEQRLTQRKRNMLYHLEMLVIDEISMVRADVLDAIDAVLRRYKYRRDLPFGGVQVVMIGDLFQLSPVVTKGDDEVAMAKYYDGPYFFHAKVMQQVHWWLRRLQAHGSSRRKRMSFTLCSRNCLIRLR